MALDLFYCWVFYSGSGVQLKYTSLLFQLCDSSLVVFNMMLDKVFIIKTITIVKTTTCNFCASITIFVFYRYLQSYFLLWANVYDDHRIKANPTFHIHATYRETVFLKNGIRKWNMSETFVLTKRKLYDRDLRIWLNNWFFVYF